MDINRKTNGQMLKKCLDIMKSNSRRQFQSSAKGNRELLPILNLLLIRDPILLPEMEVFITHQFSSLY